MTTPVSATDVKACCAAVYGSDWARLLVGDPMHPGGLSLTLRLGELLGLGPADHVIDVAAGRGVSARALACRFGCAVVGVDISEANVKAATLKADGRTSFQAGDAESLPFPDRNFSALICECSFCTFPDKGRAAAEMSRVLKPGGRIGIADLVRRRELPDELRSLAAWIACVGDARPEADYVGYLDRAGFDEPRIEVHDAALGELARQVRLRLRAATIAQRFGKLDLPAAGLDAAVDLAGTAERAISEGLLGYVLITATKR